MPGRITSSPILAALLGLVLAAPATADVLRVAPESYSVLTEPGLPTRGQHQNQVLARHGQPTKRFPDAAADHPLGL
jgi:hypothetical protein